MNVLIIDDDKVDFDAMSKILAKNDSQITVEYASTGHEALFKLDNEFDAILVDYMLPDFDGLELVKKIREKSMAPIVFVTGQGSEIVATQAIQNGCQNYFPKENLVDNGDLFYKIVSAPSNLQYLEVLTRLHILKQQARHLEAKMSNIGMDLTEIAAIV